MVHPVEQCLKSINFYVMIYLKALFAFSMRSHISIICIYIIFIWLSNINSHIHDVHCTFIFFHISPSLLSVDPTSIHRSNSLLCSVSAPRSWWSWRRAWSSAPRSPWDTPTMRSDGRMMVIVY